MSEEPSIPDTEEQESPKVVTYVQDPLFAPPRNEMLHLTDDEYEALKASLGDVGTEYSERFKQESNDREQLLERLGMTATGKTVSVRLLPESITRGDIDVRGTPTWSQLSEIHYLYYDLRRTGAMAPLDAALFRLLDPIMQGDVEGAHPNAIGEAFIGRNRSKGRPERLAAFSKAIELLQHGSADERKAIIHDMKRRLAAAKGEPVDPTVAIAKQLVLDGMPLKDGEEYGE